MIMDQLVDKDLEIKDKDDLAIHKGPMTRSQTKKLEEAIGKVLKSSWKHEESLGDGFISRDMLITIQAIPSPS